MKRAHSGASGLFVAVILLLVAAVALAVLALSSNKTQIERNTQVSNVMIGLQAGLLQFVSTNGYLPCPANPALDTGDPDPVGAAPTCNSDQGTVPWKAIGIRREDAYDPWGGKIAYRVYSGTTGLTQSNGASMVDCLKTGSHGSVDASGLCPSTHGTTEDKFLATKGLDITAFGNTAKAAYVLISHGPTGSGSYTSTGTQKPVPAAGGAEATNLNATGPFVARAASDASIDISDVNHFDDIVAFADLGTLIRAAGRGGRDWTDGTTSSVVLNSSTLQAALGTPSPPSAGDLGVSEITSGDATIRGLAGGVSQDLTYDNAAGMEGIGVAGGGSTTLQLVLTAKARKFGFTAGSFGTGVDAFLTPYAEQVQLDFFDGTTKVLTVVKTACSADPALASFTMDVGVDYDSLVLTPLFAVGAYVDAPFILSAFVACQPAAFTCSTPLSTPGNVCP